MSGFISQPVLPQYDTSKSAEENWKELTRSIEAWSNSVVRSCNDAFQRDGSRVLKSVTTTLTAGTAQFQDRALSLAANATFGGGSWKSHDTSRPSWALTLDMSLNRASIRRAAASTGNLTWTINALTQPGTGGEALRVLRGRITSTGTVGSGTGFTSVRNAVGDYTVTYSTSFSAEPSVVATAWTAATTYPRVRNYSTSSVDIHIINSTSGNLADDDFFFVVVGPA